MIISKTSKEMNHAIINLFIINVSLKFVEKYKYVLFDSTNNKLDNIEQHWTYMPILLHISWRYAFGHHYKRYGARVCWITKLLLYLQNIQKTVKFISSLIVYN